MFGLTSCLGSARVLRGLPRWVLLGGLCVDGKASLKVVLEVTTTVRVMHVATLRWDWGV